ncbi:hypothetical protein CXB51_010147 [Gossypium anomalum]|uniref:Retrovirus-related Pol polyprotein from transposon TNT 1-94 n=1 Tax=Gossypium anomalum TaxID=47600 RepID=A0A8J5Z2N6_9ROSI|nr:hypothetical protein CXB51_010147 [Gossypium anomalum]
MKKCPCLHNCAPICTSVLLYTLWCPYLHICAPARITVSLFARPCLCSHLGAPVYSLVSLFARLCPCSYFGAPDYMYVPLFCICDASENRVMTKYVNRVLMIIGKFERLESLSEHDHTIHQFTLDVMKEKTVAVLWKRIEQICMSKTLTSKLHMKQCFYAHCLEESVFIHEHLTVFKEILSNLEAMEVQYDKEDLGLILLCSLPLSYSTFRDTILYSRESLTVDEGEGLIVRGRQDQNVDYDRGKSKGRSKSSNRGKTCNFCKKKGHIKSECYKLHNKIKREAANQKGKQPKNFGKADVVEDYSNGELLVTSVNNSKVSEEWILNSGCTFHMSSNRDWFTTYKTMSEGVVLMGNNTSCKIAGVGTIKVKIFNGVVITLSDVRHVLELKRNLISLSTLDSKGYRYTAESGVLKISRGSLVGSTITGDVTIVSSSLSDDDITKLWHMRLGHMSENGMTELSKRGLLNGGIHNTKGMLEYIHSDLWRPYRVPFRGGELMNRTIMDKVRCMLSNANLPKSFWAETTSTACFLINRSPSVAIEKKTPQEVWSGNPANYFDLKMFGCPVYAHVDNGKLEPRSIKCVFLSYKAGVKGYKLWCPENRKVVISRDVVFDETAMLPNLSIKDSYNKKNQKQVEYQINTELTPQASTKIENRVTFSPQYSIAKNKTRREIKPPKMYAEADLVAYALNVDEYIGANQEPSNYFEVVSCEGSEKWMFAMQEEMESLHKIEHGIL